MTNEKYTVTAFAHNSAGVLYRLANLFLRRKVNIESLTVSETETPGISRFTIVVFMDAVKVEKLVKQLYRIIEITKVYASKDDDIIFAEVALLKVHTANAEKRREVIDITNLHSANVVHVASDYLIIDIMGKESATDSLFELLKPFGIKELVRSGRVAMEK